MAARPKTLTGLEPPDRLRVFIAGRRLVTDPTEDELEWLVEWVEQGDCEAERNLRMLCLKSAAEIWNAQTLQGAFRRLSKLHSFASNRSPRASRRGPGALTGSRPASARR